LELRVERDAFFKFLGNCQEKKWKGQKKCERKPSEGMRIENEKTERGGKQKKY